MPPRVKAAAGLAGLVQSDSEPDFNDLDPNEFSPRDTARKDAATKKPRGRPPANKVTKPAQRQGWRVGSGASSPPVSRQALKEKTTNSTRFSRAEVKQANATTNPASAKPPQTKRGRPPKASKVVEVTSASNDTRAANSPSKRARGRQHAKAANDEEEEDEMADDEDQMDLDMEEDEGANATRPEYSIPAKLSEVSPKDVSFGAVSDDVSLRRRLGDAAKRYENLETRYKELREVGIKEAERNVERIKLQAEENAIGE
jgi:hypothetical protein